MNNHNFWRNRRVFITGHTGFKGAWLCLWLYHLGAKITGYSLRPPTKPSLYQLSKINQMVSSTIADIRNPKKLYEAIVKADPEIIIHMAAQPLVRDSYQRPFETYEVNVMGTVNLLEAVRMGVQDGIGIRAVINVTTDKCYENKGWVWGYRETDSIGGYDPYSNSKACSELVTSSYRNSFFNIMDYENHGVGLASARAGNVIGGGDWAPDRLIPDCIRAMLDGEIIQIRNPNAVRPWQHVLEPLSGYILLAQKLYESGPRFADGWNFGPDDSDAKPVEWIVKTLCERWSGDVSYVIDHGKHPHEANYLKLDCSKAKQELDWHPRWNIEQAIGKVIEWTEGYREKRNVTEICLRQIEEYAKIKGQV